MESEKPVKVYWDSLVIKIENINTKKKTLRSKKFLYHKFHIVSVYIYRYVN